MLRSKLRRAVVAGLSFAIACATLVAPADATSVSLRPGGTPIVGPYLVLSGSLHDHSYDSDGHADGQQIAEWQYDHRFELGTDFGSLTDHSDGLPLAPGAPTIGNAWVHQGQIDRQFSRGGFSFLRGFEYTSDQENHLNVIGSSNFTGLLPGVIANPSMVPFYQWLTTAPVLDPTGGGAGYGGADGIGQFNHPSDKGALNFDDYAYNAAAAPLMSTIEMFGDQGSDPNSLAHADGGWYWFALSQGWNVGPVMDWDNHYWTNLFAQIAPGTTCGHGDFLPCERSLVFGTSATPAGIMDGLRARRTAATQHPSLWAAVRTPNNTWMGSTFAAVPGSHQTIVLETGSQIFPLQSVEIVSDNGVSPYPYYYGDNLACVDKTIPYGGDLSSNCLQSQSGGGQLIASYQLQHIRYRNSNGHATRKGIIDAPPAGTTLASVPLSGNRSTIAIDVSVPMNPSPRADGKHWYYAIVHAGGYRVWTAPLFSTNPGAQTMFRKRAFRR